MNKNKFAGILLVSDMDGTLLNTHDVISTQNHTALTHFVAHGGAFTIATGRIETSIEHYLPQLPMTVPAILYNGAMIYDFQSNKSLWTATLPPTIAEIIQSLTGNLPELGIEIYANSQVYLWAENAWTTEHLNRENLPIQYSSTLKGIPEPWQKILLAWAPAKIEALESHLIELNLPLSFVRSEPYFLEILPQNINKGSALTRLVYASGFDLANVVAMGDNPNDLEMLQTAGFGIAVENAHPSLKRVGVFSTCCNDDHAIAAVVDWIESGLPLFGSSREKG